MWSTLPSAANGVVIGPNIPWSFTWAFYLKPSRTGTRLHAAYSAKSCRVFASEPLGRPERLALLFHPRAADKEFAMDPVPTLNLINIKQRIDADDADLSGSTFTNVRLSGAKFQDVNLAEGVISNANLSGLRISNANLAGASIVDSATHGMTINGIAVSDLLAAYRLTDH